MKLKTVMKDSNYIWHYFTSKAECEAAAICDLIIETSPGTIWRCPVERLEATA